MLSAHPYIEIGRLEAASIHTASHEQSLRFNRLFGVVTLRGARIRVTEQRLHDVERDAFVDEEARK